LIVPHSKCGIGASLSGVRIPPSPRHTSRLSGFVWQATLETGFVAAGFGFTCQTATTVIASASEAIQERVLDCFVADAPRNDARLRSRQANRPRVITKIPPKSEGTGNAGARNAPAALRVKIENTQVSHHRHAETSGIPCTMVLRLIRALLGVPGLLATVTPEKRELLKSLITASGDQDHTTSPHA
jgi:hypothetical protein